MHRYLKVGVVVVCMKMGSLVLSKSGKAVLLYPGDGSVWITSVKYLNMLLESKLRGNVLVLKELKEATDRGLGDLGYKKGVEEKGGGVKPGSGVVLL